MSDSKQTILAVDDDEITRVLLESVLSAIGNVDIVVASSGEEAIREAASLRPDLVVLDVYMPDMNGYETCRRILAQPENHDTPIIFITALNSTADEEHGLEAGAVDFIRKPIIPRIVQARVSNILKLRAATKKLERLASIDGLTGAFNRRHFFKAADAEFARSKRYGFPLSVMMIDLDHFKAINDRWGHAVGDETLKAAVGAIQTAIRREDTLGRLGGEEFAVLLPQTDASGAALFGERLRQVISELRVETGEAPLSFTTSVGVAQVSQEDKAFKDTLARADQALYDAKDSGRNRVAVA